MATRNLLYTSTTSLIISPSKPNDNDTQSSPIDDEELFNLNSLILLPFKYLMFNKKLDPNLKDATITSICELVETSTFRLRNSWPFFFSCLRRIQFDFNLKKKKKKLKKKNKNKNVISIDEEDEVSSATNSPHSSSCNSSLNGILSSFSSSSSSSLLSQSYSSSSSSSFSFESHDDDQDDDDISSDQENKQKTLRLSSLSFKFDSIRMRLNSLIHIFNIYLNLEEFLAEENGGFEFIKCITSYLRKTRGRRRQRRRSSSSPSSDKLFYEYFECLSGGNLSQESTTSSIKTTMESLKKSKNM